MLRQLRDKRLLWPAAMTLAGVIMGVALGIWQLQRLAWKNELVTTIEARTGIAPLPADAWPNLKCRTVQDVGLELSCDYMKVTLRGTFDHARERHVFIAVPRQPNGIGGPGYWIFAPLKLPSNSGEIMVNRGFVPEAAKEPAQRPQSQPTGEVEIAGLLRSAEPRARFSGRNDPARNIWYVRAPLEFSGERAGERQRDGKESTSLGPDPRSFYVDQISPPPAGGLPLPLTGRIELVNRHLEYALTWFSLAVTLLAVFAAYAITSGKK